MLKQTFLKRSFSITSQLAKAKTPVGKHDPDTKSEKSPAEVPGYMTPPTSDDIELLGDGVWRNKVTGEMGGPKGAEPTRFGDWEQNGRITDF